jgi:hypothetical protein
MDLSSEATTIWFNNLLMDVKSNLNILENHFCSRNLLNSLEWPYYSRHIHFLILRTPQTSCIPCFPAWLPVFASLYNSPLILNREDCCSCCQGTYQQLDCTVVEILGSSHSIQVVCEFHRCLLHIVSSECNRDFRISHSMVSSARLDGLRMFYGLWFVSPTVDLFG